MTSRFSHHESCPQCGSKDNCGVWEDGHKYCFGCGWYKPGKVNMHQIYSETPEISKNSPTFPTDAQHYIPAIPMKWLLSCGIDYSAQREHNIQWSPSLEVVCWKIDDQCWQGRTFAEKALTKYLSYGKIHEKPHVLVSKQQNPLVLVEDFISALRISDFTSAMPLFGCTINLELLTELLGQFQSIIVWLDSDKLANARKIASNASLLGFFPVHVLYTEKDPKAYSSEEIKQYLDVFKGEMNA